MERLQHPPSDDEEAWEAIREHDMWIGYDEELVRSYNQIRARNNRRFYYDQVLNEYNVLAYRRVIMCPYPCKYVVMKSIRNCEFEIRTISRARRLKGVGELMACVILGRCEDNCKIQGYHNAAWSRCICN